MTILQIIGAFVIAILVVYMLFWFYKYYRTRKVIMFQKEKLVDGKHDATKYAIIDKRKIPLSAQGNEYSISFWIFVKDFNYRYGSNKSILYRGDKDNLESNPFIYFHPKNNDISVRVQLQTNLDQASTQHLEEVDKLASGVNTNPIQTAQENKEDFAVRLPYEYFKHSGKSNISGNKVSYDHMKENFEDPMPTQGVSDDNEYGQLDNRLDKVELQVQQLMGNMTEKGTTEPLEEGQLDVQDQELPIVNDHCTIKNVPLQRWTHLVVSIFNNNIEIYKDGKLFNSCALKGYPKPNLGNLHLCPDGGFNGYIANLEYSNMSATPSEVYDVYSRGPKLVKDLGDKASDIWGGFKSALSE